MSDWVPALVTGVLSASVAITVSFLTARSQRQLTWLHNNLAEQSAESAAKRSYEYDARKRLYTEVNPQLFQLREACDTSARRLRRIVSGDIQIDPPKRVVSSTERLFAPLVIAQELKRHLTGLDLGLDGSVRAQYVVSRELLWTFHEGMKIAEFEPRITYRSPGGPKEPRQHLTVAEVQRLVDFLTVKEDDGSRRPMKQNELDDMLNDEGLIRAVKPMSHLFAGADPVSSPVLWRLLLAQVSLMHVFVLLADNHLTGISGSVMPPDIGDYKDKDEPQAHFDSQVDAARRYVEHRLARL